MVKPDLDERFLIFCRFPYVENVLNLTCARFSGR